MAEVRRLFTILVAEDDDAHRDLLGQVFSALGWTVHLVPNGQEALKIARRAPIDFSILDLHMPGLNGIETIQLLHQEVKGLPCILISGQASKEEQLQAFKAGAFTFLHKPIELAMLRHAVDRLIHRHFSGA
jgi:CheY-like chemotaxis protein